MSARALVALWAPPLALMGAIFFLSAQPDLAPSQGLVDLVARKLVHAGEYGALCLLWWRALRPRIGERDAVLAAFAIAVVYAGTDELHQTFVPGRHGSPVDVGIDALGAALGAGLAARLRRLAPERQERPDLGPKASRAG